ncbi:hypothetical protein FQN55_009498 [Onygenales sp. PD_40]|nr:hypothetical protein FQN55_009498 [Onygenales sp. PD_40]
MAQTEHSREPYRWGEKGVYSRLSATFCGGGHHMDRTPFIPICFICKIGIGRNEGDTEWEISESEIRWTQMYRASSPVIFNRNEEIALSEVGHIVYPGPWLELLTLPVKDNESGATRETQFFPLCDHLNEAEEDHETFGCTFHETCWEFLLCAFGRNLSSSSQLAKITQVLREQVHYECGLKSGHKKRFFPEHIYTNINFSMDGSERWAICYLCDPKDIPELNQLYQSCERDSHGDKTESDCSEGQSPSLERLYAALPTEIKFKIAQYIEGKSLPMSSLSDVGTLSEFWRNKVFRKYGNILFDAKRYGPKQLNWQLLYDRLNGFMEVDSAPRGWRNRCRIFSLLWGTRERYLWKLPVKPTPEELMMVYRRSDLAHIKGNYFECFSLGTRPRKQKKAHRLMSCMVYY